jgi:hypothetical protein
MAGFEVSTEAGWQPWPESGNPLMEADKKMSIDHINNTP